MCRVLNFSSFCYRTVSHLVLLKVSLPLLWRQVRQAHRLKDLSLGAAGNMTIRRVKAVLRSPKAPSLFPGPYALNGDSSFAQYRLIRENGGFSPHG